MKTLICPPGVDVVGSGDTRYSVDNGRVVVPDDVAAQLTLPAHGFTYADETPTLVAEVPTPASIELSVAKASHNSEPADAAPNSEEED